MCWEHSIPYTSPHLLSCTHALTWLVRLLPCSHLSCKTIALLSESTCMFQTSAHWMFVNPACALKAYHQQWWCSCQPVQEAAVTHSLMLHMFVVQAASANNCCGAQPTCAQTVAVMHSLLLETFEVVHNLLGQTVAVGHSMDLCLPVAVGHSLLAAFALLIIKLPWHTHSTAAHVDAGLR